MINPYIQRPKKPLSNIHKNKDNIYLHISPNIFPAYNKEALYQTARPLTNRPKGKQNKKTKKHAKKNQFPQFAIKFRNQTFQSNKISDSFSSRNNVQAKLDESFGRINANIQVKQQHKPQQIMRKQSKDYNQPVQVQVQSRKNIDQNKAYQTKFNQALQKIFSSLDVFNRGSISQTNINKWIPQSALYFLGAVFQKIKQDRLNLTYIQFQSLCKPLLAQSGLEDVKWFIEQVSGKQEQLNVSIDMTSEQKCRQNSPVIMKINNNYINHYIQWPKSRNGGSISNRKQQISKGPLKIQFQQVLNNIKFKQKQLNIRLNSIKEKQSNHINNNNTLNSQFSFFNSQKNELKSIPKEDLPDFGKINLQASNLKPKIVEMAQEYQLRSNQKVTNQIPSFTFQLPKRVEQVSQYQTQILKQTENNNGYNLGHVHNSSVPKTSRIVRQSIPKQITNSCSKRSSTDSQQTDRLDKLSSRIEQYIKFNKEKLQQNKKFIKENSTPRK